MFVIHDLAVLVAVADGGSVRSAAAALGRTQPAVSQAIQRLEGAVGFSLLDRSGYRARR
jgi:DNA-binding transcriptional LysR family regulator